MVSFVYWNTRNTDMYEVIFASIGTGFNLLFNIPQIYLTYKYKDVKSLSFYTICFRLCANVCWLIYALLLSEILLAITSSVNIIAEMLLLIAKLLFRTKKDIENIKI